MKEFKVGMIVENGTSKYEVLEVVKPGYVLFKRLSDGERALANNPRWNDDGTICWGSANYYRPETSYWFLKGECYKDYELHFIDELNGFNVVEIDVACLVETDKSTYDRFKSGEYFLEEKEWFNYSFENEKTKIPYDTDIYIKTINKYFHLENCTRMDVAAMFLDKLLRIAYRRLYLLRDEESMDIEQLREINYAFFLAISDKLREKFLKIHEGASVVMTWSNKANGCNHSTIYYQTDMSVEELIGDVTDADNDFAAYDFRNEELVTLKDLINSGRLKETKILIEELLSRVVSVYSADGNEELAFQFVEGLYDSSKIVLDGSDFSELTISVHKK